MFWHIECKNTKKDVSTPGQRTNISCELNSIIERSVCTFPRTCICIVAYTIIAYRQRSLMHVLVRIFLCTGIQDDMGVEMFDKMLR
jgi:hypothetical protein